MLLNVPRCDYLTLTTFKNGEEMLASISDLYLPENGKEAKEQGYTGIRWDGLFYGIGKQRRQAHYIMRASGENSQTVLSRTANIDLSCTRIDLQVTIWLPVKYDARKLYDVLTSTDTVWPGRWLIASIIQSGDGLDTIYVGSRTSDRFVRIYVKPDSTGVAAYLRFEIEMKNSVATKAREMITANYTQIKPILLAELNRLPVASSRALSAFHAVLGYDTVKIKPERVHGQNKTIDWINTQVEPAVIRLLLSHEDGDRMLAILERWLAHIDSRYGDGE